MNRYSLFLYPETFEAVWDGRRPFEVLSVCHLAKPGDVLTLAEKLPNLGIVSGRSIEAVVTYISREIGYSGLHIAGLRIVTKVEGVLCQD